METDSDHCEVICMAIPLYPRSPNCPEQELHRAVCGVEHYGLHTEKIASGLANLNFQKFSQAAHGPGTNTNAVPGSISAWQDEFPKLRSFPPDLQMSSVEDEQNPHSFLTQLVDPLTEEHRDVTDLKHGLAGLVTFGDFEQGGDLVLKELGVRIPFQFGSHCHLRGRVEIIQAEIEAAMKNHFAPLPDSTDSRMIQLLEGGQRQEFRQLALEVQIISAIEEAQKEIVKNPFEKRPEERAQRTKANTAGETGCYESGRVNSGKHNKQNLVDDCARKET
ncbi:hypothetical protein PG994_004885 [Apiospora phragmitis]|uniref:Uncharacterized protein n=1 Tax=Apiospora phragmitis TaxID=2905665 RepID=A0ABR1VUJ0_9PEZI